MKIKILIILIVNLLFLASGGNLVWAMEHRQMNGLFSMDIPEGWQWFENTQQVIISYADGKTVAIDIQMVPSGKLTQADTQKILKEDDDKMIKEGIEAHKGALIDQKEIKLDGVYATQLDFKTAPPGPVNVTYIALFNKGYAITITYGSEDDKTQLMLDDVLATFKFK